jgi:hypothetical protein
MMAAVERSRGMIVEHHAIGIAVHHGAPNGADDGSRCSQSPPTGPCNRQYASGAVRVITPEGHCSI